jgi:ribonuclease HI
MELMAAIEALGAVPPGSELRIVSDSEYLVKGMTIWLDQWKERGWKTAQQKPPDNIDL